MSDNWTMVTAPSKDLVACLRKGTTKAQVSSCVPSPFLRPLLCGIVSSYYFRLGNYSIFILREGVAMKQVLLQRVRAIQVHVVLLKNILQ